MICALPFGTAALVRTSKAWNVFFCTTFTLMRYRPTKLRGRKKVVQSMRDTSCLGFSYVLNNSANKVNIALYDVENRIGLYICCPVDIGKISPDFSPEAGEISKAGVRASSICLCQGKKGVAASHALM